MSGRLSIRARWREFIAPLLGWSVILTAALNIASAITPDITERLRFLRHIVPGEVAAGAHAVSFSASVLLVAVGAQVVRRRRHALSVAVTLLIGIGLLNLVKGLDVEEAVLSWAVAAMLWQARAEFDVECPAGVLRATAWRALTLGSLATTAAVTAVAIALARAGADTGVRSTIHDALWLLGGQDRALPVGLGDGALRHGLGLLGLVTVIVVFAPLFRPLSTPIGEPARRTIARAHAILQTHGAGTLGFFTLRFDNHYLFSEDGSAYLAYRTEGRTVVVAGDPVGDPRSVPGLIERLTTLAARRGLRVAALGASPAFTDDWARHGMRPIYLGDEAIIETAGFSLEGRAIRKVRQSVTRLERAGYTTEIVPLRALGADDAAALEQISHRWRRGRAERGFSMALDRIGGSVQDDCVVVLARDNRGVPRGFLHFTPVYGRPAMSLAAMRRDPDTPNGLMEFLVCAAIIGLRDREVDELSLNFATFGRILRCPTTRRERALRRVIRLGDRWFQISSLLRFNEKFGPRWEPRYLICAGAAHAPAAGLASAWIEGQIPNPRRVLHAARRSP